MYITLQNPGVFSIFELFGGVLTNSISIISDSIHDIGDACSIGVSFFLEKKSKKQPDSKYTYGYSRYSVIGSVITVLILLVGSCIVIYNAILRIINPVDINYNGMILFAIIGVLVDSREIRPLLSAKLPNDALRRVGLCAYPTRHEPT